MANGAVLEPAGSAGTPVAGVQIQGVTKQYQESAIASSAATLETITPGDGSSDGVSGANIIGTVPPGKAGLKQVSTVVQRASQLLASASAGYVGNALTAVSGVGLVPTPPTGSIAADGLSQAPQHE